MIKGGAKDETVKGWKAFDKNLCCKNVQYEVGKTYKYQGDVKLCSAGFHFHKDIRNIFDFYHYGSRVCEVSAVGDYSEGGKSVTKEITILRELSAVEIDNLTDSGKFNTGYRNSGEQNSGYRNSGDENSGDENSGDRNSGDRNSGGENSGNRNSGDWNSGYRNSGDWNSGYRNSGEQNFGYRNSGSENSGDRNSGNRNSGDRNSGHWNFGNHNSGNWNSGNHNSGDWNSGNHNSGYLCTESKSYTVFDLPTKASMSIYKWPSFFFFRLLVFVPENKMSEVEKKDNPSYQTVGGYLKTLGYKEAWRISWEKADVEDRKKVLDIPNWNNGKFLEITGIDVERELATGCSGHKTGEEE